MIRVDNNFISCEVTDSIERINYLFLSTNAENIYVVENNKVIGKIQKTHYMNILKAEELGTMVSDIMEPQTIVLYKNEEHTIEDVKNEAIKIMQKNNLVKEIPVVDTSNKIGGGNI